MEFVATFFSHFGAVKYKKHLETLGINAKIAPVPRALSSSCGVCVMYESDVAHPCGNLHVARLTGAIENASDVAHPCGNLPDNVVRDIESIAEKSACGYNIIYSADD